MSRGGMVVKPAIRLMDVRAISDSGDTSSRVGTRRICVPNPASSPQSSNARISGRASERNAAADISATSGYPNATIRSSCFCASSDAFDMSTSVRGRVLFPAPSAHCECPNRRKRTFRRTDQHTDSRNGLTARFHRIEQRVWPPTKSFGAGWSTSSVNQSNLQSNSVM